jgi:hypothetical protein
MTLSAAGFGLLFAASAASLAPPNPQVYVPWTHLGAPAGPFAVVTNAADQKGVKRAIELHSTRAPQPSEYGIAYTVLSSKNFRGHRVRVRAQVKAIAEGQIAALFVRSATEDTDQNSLEGVRSSRLGGPQWHPLDVVVDVLPQDVLLVIGLVLRGEGDILAEPPTVAIVGNDVPLSLPAVGSSQPSVLEFEPDTDF